MTQTQAATILFLCPHNAAKSVLAAAYFHQLAQERGLGYRGVSAGTEPDDRPSPAVVTALREDGIDVSAHRPRLVTRADLERAVRVVSLGCDVSDMAPPAAPIENWDDVPPPSRDLTGARQAIRRRVAVLVEDLADARA